MSLFRVHPHCSTQHNNERLVKLLALMAATGKTEIWSAIFAAASNDFMCEHHTGSTGTDNDEEQPNGIPEGDEDGLKRRNQGNQRGKKKLFNIAKAVMEKEVQLSKCLQILGPT
jgi:hypothetical protein